MNPLIWLMFPFACVLLVFVLMMIVRLVHWFRHRLDWHNFVRTQRTQWEQDEIELLRGDDGNV